MSDWHVRSIDEIPDGDGRAFLQRRLRAFGRIIALLLWAGIAVHLVNAHLVPETAPQNEAVWVGSLVGWGIVTTALWWVMGRARAFSLRTLRLVDAIVFPVLGAWVAVTVHEISQRTDDVYFVFGLASFLVLGRALFIPGSTRRTLRISSVIGLMMLAASCEIALRHPERLTIPALGFLTYMVFMVLVVPVAFATFGSWVIEGLRDRVREARRLGQYVLGDKIGEGGMGVVYKASHAMLRRPTAIKLLPANRSSAEEIRRFEREVQMTSELTDPHTVAIFDYGRSPDGTFYYAMEYLDGIDLERLVRRRGALPPGRVVYLLRQVCDALEEAHGRGLIHRDIKPANLILCQRGKHADVVKVVDFGLVKEMGRDEGAATLAVAGSPSYLSPEAIRDPESVQAASDLYAVGMVGYYLLTERTLFAGKTFLEICGHHLNTPPAPPSSAASQLIPAGLDDLVLCCLQKDPRRRPESAAELRAALDALDGVEPWTDADAEAWWSEFRADPSQVRPAVGAGGQAEAQTMIVDFRGRGGGA